MIAFLWLVGCMVDKFMISGTSIVLESYLTIFCSSTCSVVIITVILPCYFSKSYSSYFKKNFIVLVPQKLVVKPQSQVNENKKCFDKFYELMIFGVM